MRRLSALLVLVFLAQLAPSVWAKPLPKEIKYTIYARGEPAGRSDMKVSQTADAIVFETTTRVEFGPGQVLDMTSRTVADPETFLIREFSYDGTRVDQKLSGEIFVAGDSLYGTTTAGEASKADYKISPFEHNLMLQDFVMSHEVLFALAHDAAGHGMNETAEYGLLFPSTFTMSKAVLGYASTLEIESDTRAAVCRKLLIAIQGSEPFASYVDVERGIPAYMAFPQTNVEVFLDDFFGESPVSRFRE